MRKTTVFLALTKPTTIYGLPIGYFVGLIFASVIPFILFDNIKFLLVLVVGYPILWVIADRNPHLFQLIAVKMANNPRTANHKIHEGNHYES